MTAILGTVTKSTAEEPAEVAALELPGRALILLGTYLLLPARCHRVLSAPLVNEQEIELPLDVCRYRSPSLFIAVDCLERHTQK